MWYVPPPVPGPGAGIPGRSTGNLVPLNRASATPPGLPGGREGQLALAADWQSAASAGAWNLPAAVLPELDALATAKNETTRTPVATARCKEAFGALIAKMRDIKRRCFLTPPLQDSDYIALGLKPRDNTLTASGTPTAQVRVETYLVGRHELGVKIIYVTGNPTEGANKGYRIWYCVNAPGEGAPASPGDLHRSFFTKRKKDLIEFDFGDSGKPAYFAVRVENENKQGPRGLLVSALIL